MIRDVDPERVRKLVGSMREAVRILHEIKCMDKREFKEDHRNLNVNCKDISEE